MSAFRMPSLGADMAAATLVEWRVAPGSRVAAGDIVAVVETDKGAIEVESFEAGTVSRLLVEEGVKVPVGTPLAELDPPVGAALAAPPANADPGMPWIRSSPSARAHAQELGVSLAACLPGSGPHGAVVRADVDRLAARTSVPSPSPPGAAAKARGEAAEPEAPTRRMSTQDAATAALAMRRAIAAAMERSHREIPHYYLAHDIDLGRAVAWLAARNASRTVERRVLLAALLLHTVARCLPRFPELNGHWIDGEHRPAAGIDLGVAISLRSGGLITPCIHGAERLDLDGTMLALGDLAGRARSGRLRSSDLAGGTITVSNLGDLGADSVFGLIYPPQVALVGFGRVVERCVAHEGMLGVRPVLRATLAGDHRASDGHRGGLFLAALDHALQEPTP